MALTREFKDTVKARAARDPDFREALLIEAAQQLLAGDLETGKAVLRDYINATVGFERLTRETGTPPKSLMRMLGRRAIHGEAICWRYSANCSGFQEYIWRLRRDASRSLP